LQLEDQGVYLPACSQEIAQLFYLEENRIANNLAENKATIPSDVVTSTVQLAIDGSNMIGDQFQAISNVRRMEIRKFLSPEYMDICNLKVISLKNYSIKLFIRGSSYN